MESSDVLALVLFVAVSAALVWMERRRLLPGAFGLPAGVAPPVVRTYDWRLMRQAGRTPESVGPVLVGARIASALILPMILGELGGGPTMLLLAVPFGAAVPDALLALVRRQRQKAIRRSLSFFLDLMLSLLQAGMTIDEAFRRSAQQGLSPKHPLADEIDRIVTELGVGRDRTAAFASLADRTGVDELRALADAIALGATRGVSLESVLKAQADLARAKRREDGLKRLDKANAEILLPIVLCSFPMFVALVVVPLGIQFMAGLEALARALR
jgi:tight adherence protein C